MSRKEKERLKTLERIAMVTAIIKLIDTILTIIQSFL